MKTSQAVSEVGLYTSECCNAERTFDIGDTFVRCPKCQGLCEWDFQYELTTSENLEPLDEHAA